MKSVTELRRKALKLWSKGKNKKASKVAGKIIRRLAKDNV